MKVNFQVHFHPPLLLSLPFSIKPNEYAKQSRGVFGQQFQLFFLFLKWKNRAFLHGVRLLFFTKPGFKMSLNEIYEESAMNQPELRGTRIAPATTLVIGVTLLTQLMVLSGVAIIMGIAVVTMCALVVEILVLMAVATVLERGIVDTEDLGSIMEITATLFITVSTVALASTSGDGDSSKPAFIPGYPVAALKLS